MARALGILVAFAAVIAAAVFALDARGVQPTAVTPAPAVDAPQARTVAAAITPERRLFDASSPWNQRVDDAPVDVRSAAMLTLASQRVGVVERAGDLPPRTEQRTVTEGVYVNTRAWATPVVSGGPATRVSCRQVLCGDAKGLRSLPIPADVDPDPRYDGWFTVFDAAGRYAYDFWRARREHDGSISYQFARRWDLHGPGYGKPGQVAARGSGLPLFAGAIRPRELAAGEINHALAIAVPGPAQHNYVQPASVTDGNGRLESLPEGARLRLKAGVAFTAPQDPKTGRPRRLSRAQRRVGDAIVAALRRYGAIVVDRAAVPTLYAQRDAVDSMLTGAELEGLHLNDFEVIELGRVLKDPPLATASQSGPAQETR